MSPGEWLGTGEGLPLFDVLADVETGALGRCWPQNTAPLRSFGLLRTRLSWLPGGGLLFGSRLPALRFFPTY